jgi:Flp pilus assembly protein CpaB
MNSIHKFTGPSLTGAAAILALALAGPSLSVAQENQQSGQQQEEETVALTTEEKICEAQQRTEARWQKWLNEGIPEEFGSEEPFTFDPSLC